MFRFGLGPFSRPRPVGDRRRRRGQQAVARAFSHGRKTGRLPPFRGCEFAPLFLLYLKPSHQVEFISLKFLKFIVIVNNINIYFGASFAQIVHIGDSEASDLAGALSAGMRAVLLTRPGAAPGPPPLAAPAQQPAPAPAPAAAVPVAVPAAGAPAAPSAGVRYEELPNPLRWREVGGLEAAVEVVLGDWGSAR